MNDKSEIGNRKSKIRLDIALVERGLVSTRAKAQALIMARRVQVNGAFVEKPGSQVSPADEVRVTELEHPYVSRGGVKLRGALDEFGIELSGIICADVGASTGGFTDVMLKAGASRVYAIDVGYGQLDASLRTDPRVVVRERVNARNLEASDFDELPQFAAIDVSFISLKLILPAVVRFLDPQGQIVALVKPQFEVGKGEVGKGGIVRDAGQRQAALDGVLSFARNAGLELRGVIESPIKGAEGNVEYLAWLQRSTLSAPPPTIPARLR